MTYYPRISIVTPNYNCARYLASTIESVLSQDYPNLQYIVVDGGSTDGSVDVIKRYAAQLDHWISEPDQGPADAIAKGFALADGEWLTWLNSDDVLLPRALFALANIIRLKPSAGWIVGNRLESDDEGLLRGGGQSCVGNSGFLFLGRLDIPQDATFFRRQLFDNVGGINRDVRSIFDTDLFGRLMLKEKPLLTSAYFSVFRQRPDQVSRNSTLKLQELHLFRSYERQLSLGKSFFGRLYDSRVGFVVKGVLAALMAWRVVRAPRKWLVAVPNEYGSGFVIRRLRDI